MKKTIFFALVIVFFCVLGLTGCAIFASAEKLEAYEFGTDSIPSVNSVVGERKVTGVKSGIDNGISYKEYTYESDTVTEDLASYLIDNLMEGDWYALVDFNLKNVPGTVQLGMQSGDSGQVIIMDVTYEEDGYTIKLTKGEGTLTLY